MLTMFSHLKQNKLAEHKKSINEHNTRFCLQTIRFEIRMLRHCRWLSFDFRFDNRSTYKVRCTRAARASRARRLAGSSGYAPSCNKCSCGVYPGCFVLINFRCQLLSAVVGSRVGPNINIPLRYLKLID